MSLYLDSALWRGIARKSDLVARSHSQLLLAVQSFHRLLLRIRLSDSMGYENGVCLRMRHLERSFTCTGAQEETKTRVLRALGWSREGDGDRGLAWPWDRDLLFSWFRHTSDELTKTDRCLRRAKSQKVWGRRERIESPSRAADSVRVSVDHLTASYSFTSKASSPSFFSLHSLFTLPLHSTLTHPSYSSATTTDGTTKRHRCQQVPRSGLRDRHLPHPQELNRHLTGLPSWQLHWYEDFWQDRHPGFHRAHNSSCHLSTADQVSWNKPFHFLVFLHAY